MSSTEKKSSRRIISKPASAKRARATRSPSTSALAQDNTSKGKGKQKLTEIWLDDGSASDAEYIDIDAVSGDSGSLDDPKVTSGPASPPVVPVGAENVGAPKTKTKRFRRRPSSDVVFPAPKDTFGGPPLPESDLLKTIHYMAAKYYDERGLTSTSATWKGKEKEASGDAETPDTTMEDFTLSDSSRKTGIRRKGGQVNDMLTNLDGTVLIALAILMEEDIKHQLRPSQLPEGWDSMEVEDDSEEDDIAQNSSESEHGNASILET